MYRGAPALGSFILLLSTLSACGGSPDHATYQVRDSAGVKLVMNGAEGAWAPDQVWQFQEDLRIGSPEDAPGREFGMLSAVAVDRRGVISVFDLTAQHVQQFDSSGAYLRTFGGPGEGPGQFGRFTREVLAGDGDSLIVPDMGNQRVDVLSPDGQFVRSYPNPAAPAIPYEWKTLPGGEVAAKVDVMVMPGQSAENRSNVIVRVGRDGIMLDTIVSLPLDPILDISQGPAGMKTRFFNSTATWATNGDGLVAAGMTADYRLSVYDAGGTLRMIFGRQHTPSAVSRSDRDAVTRAHLEAMQDQMSKVKNAEVRGIMEQMAGNIEFGDTYPAIGGIVAGPDGTWLVRRPVSASELTRAMGRPQENEPKAAPESDVFDAEGRFLGTVRFPAGFRLAAVAGGKFYGIETDSLDIPSVVRLVRTGSVSTR